MRLSAAFARLVALVAASLGLLAGTPPAAAAESDDPRELVIGITQFPPPFTRPSTPCSPRATPSGSRAGP